MSGIPVSFRPGANFEFQKRPRGDLTGQPYYNRTTTALQRGLPPHEPRGLLESLPCFDSDPLICPWSLCECTARSSVLDHGVVAGVNDGDGLTGPNRQLGGPAVRALDLVRRQPYW